MTYIRPFLAVIVSAVLAQAASAQGPFTGGFIDPGRATNLNAGLTGTTPNFNTITVPTGQITNLANFRIEIDVTWSTAPARGPATCRF